MKNTLFIIYILVCKVFYSQAIYTGALIYFEEPGVVVYVDGKKNSF